MKNNIKKAITIFAITLISINSFAQAPNYLWAKSAGGSFYESAMDIAVDANGNSYVTGEFDSPSITFGSINLINTNHNNIGGYTDIFTVKYDAGGNVVWAKSAGSIYSEGSKGICVDANGNSYVTGYYGASVTFGTTTLTGAGGYEMFLVKYDPNGNVVWAKSAGGIGSETGYAIALDESGNILVTGSCSTAPFTVGSSTITPSGSSDMLIVKYDANGNVIWAKSSGGSWNDNAVGVGIDVDGNGNSYVTGSFSTVYYSSDPWSVITLGNTNLINVGHSNNFIVKYDANGNVVWAKNSGGNLLAVDVSGNSYVTGNSGSDFIIKYDTDGNVLWKRTGGSFNIYARDITIDANGNSYVTGSFKSSSVTFENITLSNSASAGNSNDIFIVKHDTNGNVIWARSVGENGNDAGYAIAVDGAEDSYVAGNFYSPSITFGISTLYNVDTSNADIFVVKLNSVTGIPEMQNEIGFTIAPNPFSSQTTITFNESQKNTTIKIFDILGKEIKTVIISGKQYTVEKGEMKEGIYFVQIMDENKKTVNTKIIIQ